MDFGGVWFGVQVSTFELSQAHRGPARRRNQHVAPLTGGPGRLAPQSRGAAQRGSVQQGHFCAVESIRSLETTEL